MIVGSGEIEDVGAVEACAQAIKAHLAPIGAKAVAPAVLQPAGLYLELVGEVLRRRAVLTHNDALCLRPDMTVPAARLALSLPLWHGEGFALAYDGRVFRRLEHAAQPIEPRQIGLEWYAPKTHSAARDAGVLSAALGACEAVGARASLVLGCAALARALVLACNLPEAMSRLLTRSHDVRATIQATIAGEEAQREEPQSALGAALALASPEGAQALLEDVLALAGVAQISGRSLQEVAARLREKAMRASDPRVDRCLLEHLAAVFAIEAAPPDAFKALRQAVAGLPAPQPVFDRLDDLERLWTQVAQSNPAMRDAVFRAAFDRNLEYYDGLAFDLIGKSGAVLGGGGRYDQVLTALTRAQDPPGQSADGWGAAGFSLYPAVLAAEHSQ